MREKIVCLVLLVCYDTLLTLPADTQTDKDGIATFRLPLHCSGKFSVTHPSTRNTQTMDFQIAGRTDINKLLTFTLTE